MLKPPFSRIIAGTMTWGDWGAQLSRKEMSERISHFSEMGVSTFDHADIYGGYTTETQFGAALRDSTVARNQIQLISKCGIQYPSEIRPHKIKYYDYSKSYIIGSVEESLSKLQTDYLDLLLLHRPSPLMEPAEIQEAVTTLKKTGKILHFGVSNFTRSQMELLKDCAPEVNQLQFSVTHPGPMVDGSLDYMLQSNIVPMAWNPLGNVFRESNEQTTRIRVALQQLREKYNVSEETLLLAWILRHPAKIHPVAGTTDTNRMRAMQHVLRLEWDTADWFALWVAARGEKVP